MEPVISRLCLTSGINIHVMRTRQFKTLLVRLVVRVPLEEETASANALINQITARLSRPWPELKAVNRRLDELFGASLYPSVHKMGESQLLEWTLNCAAPERVGRPELLKEALQFMRDMVCDPLLEDQAFDTALFEQEKSILLQEQEARQNDKMTYAYERCIEELCAGEPFAVHRLGTSDTLEKAEPAGLYGHYLDLLGRAHIDWIIVGDVEPAVMGDMLNDVFRLPPRSPLPWGRELIRGSGALRRVTEPMDVKQGKLNMGFRTGIPYESPAYDASLLMGVIFGGGASSRLFQTVREKESLCYSIYARNEKFKSLLIVGAGIDLDKADVVEESVLRELALIRKGEFTEEDLKLAKMTVIRSLNAIRDSQSGLADYYYSQHLSTRRYDVREAVNALQGVSREEVVAAAQPVGLEVVYFLSGKEEQA